MHEICVFDKDAFRRFDHKPKLFRLGQQRQDRILLDQLGLADQAGRHRGDGDDHGGTALQGRPPRCLGCDVPLDDFRCLPEEGPGRGGVAAQHPHGRGALHQASYNVTPIVAGAAHDQYARKMRLVHRSPVHGSRMTGDFIECHLR